MIGTETALEDPRRRRALDRRVGSLVAHNVSVADGDARVDGAMVGAVGNKQTYILRMTKFRVFDGGDLEPLAKSVWRIKHVYTDYDDSTMTRLVITIILIIIRTIVTVVTIITVIKNNTKTVIITKITIIKIIVIYSVDNCILWWRPLAQP